MLLWRVRRREPLAIGRVSIEMPSLAITLRQLLASTVDLAAATAALSAISERWLISHHVAERRFSVAAFEPRFIAAQSAALACRDGEPLAFVTFMTTDLHTQATIGLMRQVPTAPAARWSSCSPGLHSS